MHTCSIALLPHVNCWWSFSERSLRCLGCAARRLLRSRKDCYFPHFSNACSRLLVSRALDCTYPRQIWAARNRYHGAASHIITYAVLSSHPPYPALIVVNAISGLENGLLDACFCVWVGAMGKGNTIQGFLHACYSLGALFSPLIATNMVVKAMAPWFSFYYIMVRIGDFCRSTL